MTVTVAARAHRILRRMKSWYSARDQEGPKDVPVLPLRPGEERIGFYDNNAAAPPVQVTNAAVWVEVGGRWRGLYYEDIGEVRGPGEGDPRDASGVWVRLNSGAVMEIPILGGNEQFRDAWEFTRFLMRVLEDRRTTPGT